MPAGSWEWSRPHNPKHTQGLEDGGDLVFARFAGPAEEGGEGLGPGSVRGDEGADQGDLFGEGLGPGADGGDGPGGTADFR